MEALHEHRDELVGRKRKATERAIFRRDDDVKPPRRRGDQLLFCEAVQRKLGSGCGNPESRRNLMRAEVVAPACGKPLDVLSGVAKFMFHLRKASVFDTFRK